MDSIKHFRTRCWHVPVVSAKWNGFSWGDRLTAYQMWKGRRAYLLFYPKWLQRFIIHQSSPFPMCIIVSPADSAISTRVQQGGVNSWISANIFDLSSGHLVHLISGITSNDRTVSLSRFQKSRVFSSSSGCQVSNKMWWASTSRL